MSGIELPEDYLAQFWGRIDWEEAGRRLADLQSKLADAAYERNRERILELQEQIADDLLCRCLAVRHVAESQAGPGIDKVKWTTDGQKMAAAIRLSPKDFEAQPQRQVIITAKNSGKKRRARIGTYFDRAMATLYAYTLIPVTEASAERKSFAFRTGRSALDAQQYVMDALTDSDAPHIVIVADIKSYYASIEHRWLMEHAPMNKHVLRQLLNAGFVYAGELFPSGDHGISEGSGLSPALGNFVLDGLQSRIYWALNEGAPIADYANGGMVRYADDIIVTARTFDAANVALGAIKAFLSERGLVLSEDKTRICTVEQGFTFLSRTYIRKGDYISSYPADEAVQRFCAELHEVIMGWRKSQRELIRHLNRKLKGWAGYHRYSDAREAFAAVDAAVQASLLEAARAKHPKMKVQDIVSRYWYEEPDGTHVYALPDDKSVKVFRMSNTVLARHRKVRVTTNPFTDQDYFHNREMERDIANVSGPYRAVWERQEGRCYYCGAPILVDQHKAVVRLNHNKGDSPKNAAYIHRACAFDEVESFMVDSFASLGRYDALAPLVSLEGELRGEHRPIPPNWKYGPLKAHFATQTKPTLTLTFQEIERIIGVPLCNTAKARNRWWKDETGHVTISRAWTTEGYALLEADCERGRVKFVRTQPDTVHLEVPAALTQRRIPDNAVFELEQFFDYIIDKYAL